MPVTLNQETPNQYFEVSIGMRNSVRVEATSDLRSAVKDVINKALDQMNLSNDEVGIFTGSGSFAQSVFVNGERAVQPDTLVTPGSRIVIDQRKKNG